MTIHTLGSLYVIAAPSGGGKTSLIRGLLARVDNLEFSVSHTTRSQRPGEIDGRDYHFIDQSRFDQMVEADDFVEYATVFKHSYGTSKQQISDRLRQGIDIILEIDWQGARQIKASFEQAIGIFILPPSVEVLHQRLSGRGQDDADIIAHRMDKAREEMSHYGEFDYLIINDRFEESIDKLQHIIKAQRLNGHAQAIRHSKLLSNLLRSQ